MSYILSALRKAERDRQQSDPVTAESFIAGDAPVGIDSDNRPVKGQWTVAVAVLTISVLALGLAALMLSERNAVPGERDVGNRLTESKPIDYRVPVIEEKPVEPPPATDKTEEKAAANNSLPAPAQSSVQPLPTLNITGYIFFEDDPARSKLFVDGIVYRKDSRLGPGLILTGFERDRVEVSFEGRSREIPVP